MAYNNTGLEPIEPLLFKMPGMLSSEVKKANQKQTEVKKAPAKEAVKR